MKIITVIVMLLLLFIGCDRKKSVNPDVATHTLRGQAANQFGIPAAGLTVDVDGPYQYHSSAVTDSTGAFSVETSEGATIITFRSFETAVYNLPLYITKDTLLLIQSDTTIIMRIREFTTIFHDPGNKPSEWSMNGGVSCDSTRYIFHDMDNFTDNMMMADACTIPDTVEHVGFILYGRAAPSDTSQIIVNTWVNGNLFDAHWTANFTAAPSYYHGSLITVPGVEGGRLQLNLIFNEIGATYIYISDIWIYSY